MLRIITKSIFRIRLNYKFTISTMEPIKEIKFIDYQTDQYGDYPGIKSTFRSNRVWSQIRNIDQNLQGKQVLVRARVHAIRAKGNNCFIVLRESFYTLQTCAFKSEAVSKQMIKYMGDVPIESIVDIVGKVKKPQKAIESCTQPVELEILKFFVVNRATGRLPLQILDASRKVIGNQFEIEEEQDKKEQKTEIKIQQGKKQQPKVQEKKIEEKDDQKGQEKIEGQENEKKDKKKQKKDKKKKEQKEKQKQKQAEKQKQAIVKMKTRLDNRVIDLRTQAKQAIFRLSSGVCQIFRQFLLKQDFIEIHTPKLIGGSSEGGANVFNLKYFNKQACLAQSPQLYKQMCVMSDFQRVFEIGPVFRAQNSFTHRHMCQFVGLDIQMAIKQHYFQLLDFFGELFPYIFQNLSKRYQKQLKAINQQFQCEPFKCKYPAVRLTFEQGIKLLRQNGLQWKDDQDLSTEIQRKLGQIVKNKYDTDFYMLHRYPVSARPFYTNLCEDDPRYTCSYDMFMRGQEILSGAQRIHDPDMLENRAIACGIDPKTIRDYIKCFNYGAYPHGGGGIGLQRVVMLFCGLRNIRNASLFPRDPKRITP